MPEEGLREHYLRALHLLRDMFEQLAVEHLDQAPDRVPFEVPRDVVVGWRTRAAALPLEEIAAQSSDWASADDAAGELLARDMHDVPLLNLVLPLDSELVIAVMRGVSDAVEQLGYTAHIGPGAHLVARRARVVR